jgi:hypothetical protein
MLNTIRILTALFISCFLFDSQTLRAQCPYVTTTFDFESGFNLASDGAIISSSSAIVTGRPKVKKSCTFLTKSLILEYSHCPSPSTSAVDVLFLEHNFVKGQTYEIRFDISGTESGYFPFVLDVATTGTTPTSSPGAEVTNTCGVAGYNQTPFLPNSVMIKRLNRAEVITPGGLCSPTNISSIIYKAPINSSFIQFRLDADGWSLPSVSRKVTVSLDNIKITHLNDPADFFLTVDSKAEGSYNPPLATTYSWFNFEAKPIDPSCSSYKLEVRKSTAFTERNYDSNPICTITSTLAGVLKTASDPNRTLYGFLSFENGGNCFYEIRLIVEKCGNTYCSTREVGVGYFVDIFNQRANKPFNNGFNFTVNDDEFGHYRKRTFAARNNDSTANSYYWVRGYDTQWSGGIPRPGEVGVTSYTRDHSQGFRDLPINGDYVKLRNDFNFNSTHEGLILFDTYSPCPATAPNEENSSIIASEKKIQLQKVGDVFSVSPNPMSDQAVVQYTLKQPSRVRIYVTDITGKEIANLLQNSEHGSGDFSISIPRNGAPSGMYFVVLENSQGKFVKKLIFD